MGEFGIPFDLAGERVFWTGDFRPQECALARSFRALDDSLLGGASWNYTSDNDNAHGDQGNDEDLSIFSPDQQAVTSHSDSGGRAVRDFARPYAMAIAGKPLRMSFDRRRLFRLSFQDDPAVDAPREIFVSEVQYRRGYRVEVSDGVWTSGDEPQVLFCRAAASLAAQAVRIYASWPDVSRTIVRGQASPAAPRAMRTPASLTASGPPVKRSSRGRA
ncbi:MAG: hypothetical protein M1337_05355 [Actinobacteria bacterium]|nr:hypothetical protein [Actinomycetota bacterium]